MATLPESTPPDRKVVPLRLPNLGDEGQPGARFVKRAVSWTLGTLALLVVLGLLVSAVVSMDVTVKVSGTLEPVRIYTVRAQEAGAVRHVLVNTGDTVQAGDPVIRLDSLTLVTNLAQLESQYRAAQIERDRSASQVPMDQREQAGRLAQAESRLVSARAALLQRMVQAGVGTNVDSLLRAYRPGAHVGLDQTVGEVRSAEADIAVAKTQIGKLDLTSFDRQRFAAQMEELAAQIRNTRARLERLVITSPAAGVVLTQQIERLPGSFVREGDLLLEVADLADWHVTFAVSERDLNKISVGDSVKVEVQAFDPDDRDQLSGNIVFAAAEPGSGDAQTGAQGVQPAAVSAGPGTYRVTASLDKTQLAEVGIDRFRRGYTVQGHVITRSGRIISLLWNYLTEKLQG